MKLLDSRLHHPSLRPNLPNQVRGSTRPLSRGERSNGLAAAYTQPINPTIFIRIPEKMSENKYKVGLFDCFADIKQCFIGCCIPGLSYSQTDYRLSTNPSTLEGHEPINTTSLGACGLFYFCGCVGFVLPYLHRQKIRQRYNIAGGDMGDCCVTYWCPACALIQNEKEVILRESEAAGAVTEQPKAPETMTYPAK